MASVEQLVLELADPATRENALLDLSKKREAFPELAPYLWHSFGTIAALLQEVVSIYPLLSPPALTAHASNRVCNALALLQCVASHPDTRALFLQGASGEVEGMRRRIFGVRGGGMRVRARTRTWGGTCGVDAGGAGPGGGGRAARERTRKPPPTPPGIFFPSTSPPTCPSLSPPFPSPRPPLPVPLPQYRLQDPAL